MNDITVDSKLKIANPKAIEAPTIERPSENEKGPSFNNVLKEAIDEVNQLSKDADKAVVELTTGKSDNLHETMIALRKAELSFKLMMTVRQKILDAYTEVMRMGV